jgi:nicotinate-nucleotide adenylyltransferase
MGSDSFQNLPKWRNAEFLFKNYVFLVYLRPGFPVQDTFGANVHVMEAPLLEISATHIRKLVQAGKSIRYLVPPAIEEEIAANRFFRF